MRRCNLCSVFAPVGSHASSFVWPLCLCKLLLVRCSHSRGPPPSAAQLRTQKTKGLSAAARTHSCDKAQRVFTVWNLLGRVRLILIIDALWHFTDDDHLIRPELRMITTLPTGLRAVAASISLASFDVLRKSRHREILNLFSSNCSLVHNSSKWKYFWLVLTKVEKKADYTTGEHTWGTWGSMLQPEIDHRAMETQYYVTLHEKRVQFSWCKHSHYVKIKNDQIYSSSLTSFYVFLNKQRNKKLSVCLSLNNTQSLHAMLTALTPAC